MSLPLEPINEEAQEWFREQWASVEKECGSEGLGRMKDMFMGLAKNEPPRFQYPMQEPEMYYMRELTAKPVHDPKDHPILQKLESKWEVIRGEMEALRVSNESTYTKPRSDDEAVPDYGPATGFAEYFGIDERGVLTTTGNWKVFYFYKHFIRQDDNCKLCPETAKLIDRMMEEGLLVGGMVCFSRITPGTRIMPHTGPSNMRLTCHLGLCGCDGVTLRVARDNYVPYRNGKCFIFDDSFEHEVRHQGEDLRVTFMFDLWHPEITSAERDCFRIIAGRALDGGAYDKFLNRCF
eukprot:TRINITY_DN9050_c0_g1_i1.p2 TRINITY_DN9050_c0_g1~~TRINITY_DN9050_c0_g1_i1.p2  ORF type:complete len:293 (-),score=85.93 TRINITY_DN9050_c0_g1_i1:149-1027(-)